MGIMSQSGMSRNMNKKELQKKILDAKKKYLNRMNSADRNKQRDAEERTEELAALENFLKNVPDDALKAGLAAETFDAVSEKNSMDKGFLEALQTAASSPADYQHNENYKQAAAVAFHLKKMNLTDLSKEWLDYAKSCNARDVQNLIAERFFSEVTGTPQQQPYPHPTPQTYQQSAQKARPQPVPQPAPQPQSIPQPQTVPQPNAQTTQRQVFPQPNAQTVPRPTQQTKINRSAPDTDQAPKKKSIIGTIFRVIKYYFIALIVCSILTFFLPSSIMRPISSVVTFPLRIVMRIAGITSSDKNKETQSRINLKDVDDSDATPAEFFEYYTNDYGVIIEGYTGKNAVVVIPTAIDDTIVYAIKSDAFRDNTFITDVTIKRGTMIIGENAFRGCKSLQRLVLPDTLDRIQNNAFYECISLTVVDIPDGVTAIGSQAFQDCRSMQSVSIPGSVNVIEDHAFKNCISLSRLTLATRDKDASTDEEAEDTAIRSWAFEACSSLAEVEVPGHFKSIGEGVFYQCESLQSVYLSGGVKTIGDRSFDECVALWQFQWDASEEVYADQSIGNNAFRDCVSLQEVVLNGSVASVGDGAFQGCTALRSFSWEASGAVYEDQVIGNSALSANPTLSVVRLSANVGEIRDNLLKDSDQAVIYAPADSAAETYAHENSIPFVAE